MTLCRWFGDTWLGAFFWRVLGHRWEHAGNVGPYIENRCRCGAWRHAHTYWDRVEGVADAYEWERGRAPNAGGVSA